MVNQLNTIFTYQEIKWNKSLEFKNDKLPDLHAGWCNDSYNQLGLPQGVLSVLADVWETAQKHMTNTIYKQGKMIRGMVLDSPLKGKITKTCVVEGTISIV